MASAAGVAATVASALAQLGLNNQLVQDVIGLAITVATFVGTLVLVLLVGRLLLVSLVDRVLKSRDLDEHARKPLLKVTFYLVVFVAITAAFGAAGFTGFLTSLATIAAAATLAIGFAMQDILKNFVSGIFIFADKPFRMGDWIEWDGNSGVVEDITLRVTRVRTFDNELLTVPNSDLTDGVVKNPVAKETLRVKFVFGIGYDDDIERATDIILEEARNHPRILNEEGHEPSVRLTELADSSVGLQSRIWIRDPTRADFVKIRGEYVTAVKQRFDEAGIDIPYPVRTLDGGIDITDSAQLADAADD
ncbi:mechanosensitive ion channel protein [Halobacteriales archaeon QS_8_69_26]|nr:MAG: mechanosensitive ion channel protein [Halobacteriales archaeon QS_8_69_26]